MKKTVLFIYFFSVALLFCRAFSFSPIVRDFDSSGKGKIQTFRIGNEDDAPIAIQISILTRKMDITGKETNKDAPDLFTVYPRQLILQPGASQSVRVQWNGPVVTGEEWAFRIVAEQLPISFDRKKSEKSQLNIVYKYVGSIYVTPEEGLRSDLKIDSIKASGDKLIVAILNAGTGHTIIDNPVLTLKDGDTTVSLNSGDLKGLAGENILAGVLREFIIDRPPALKGDNISGEITYTETR